MEASIVQFGQHTPQLSKAESNDTKVIDMWLHGRSPHTQRGYRRDVEKFLDYVGVGIREVTLSDLQAYADSITGQDTTKARYLAAVKSLLKFAHRLGYTRYDVGAVLRLPKIECKLAQRILTEEQVMRIIALETNPRNAALLRLLYASAGRVSEICALEWKDTQPREEGKGQVTLYGKGGKTRAVLLSVDTWSALEKIRGKARPEDPVFPSRKGKGHLDPTQVLRIVRAAARRAGIDAKVSPHWFRHSHASHALDRHAPIHVVQTTLGHSSLATTSRYTHARPGESSALYLTV